VVSGVTLQTGFAICVTVVGCSLFFFFLSSRFTTKLGDTLIFLGYLCAPLVNGRLDITREESRMLRTENCLWPSEQYVKPSSPIRKNVEPQLPDSHSKSMCVYSSAGVLQHIIDGERGVMRVGTNCGDTQMYD